MKVAFVVCYKQPNYVRATSLRAALATVPDLEVIDIRNRHLGLARFIEVSLKLLRSRWRDKPDVYVLTFRGYEMLLFLVMTLIRKPIIFDELVNFTEWMEEHQKIKPGTIKYKLFRRWYGWLTKHCRFILADTEAHARYSAELNHLPIDIYRTIPVGTDETVFYPQSIKKIGGDFTVFYYGSMRPLHGLNYLLEAAQKLKDEPAINFLIVGGKGEVEKACLVAAQSGAHVSYKPWITFDELPTTALMAGLTVGGPFGKTTQSQYVITGKTYQFIAIGAPVLIGQNEVNNLFQDKINCLMVPQADAKALADSISWAYKHPAELENIGQNGRQFYEEHFSQTVINSLMNDLFQSL